MTQDITANKVSIIIPIRTYEGDVVAELVSRTHKAMQKHDMAYELIFVDNHPASIAEAAAQARYDLVATLDPNLPDTGEQIPLMVIALGNEYDLIQGITRSSGFVKLLHGIEFDPTSTLKVYKASIVKEIELNPQAKQMDLEFFIRAKNAGYRIASFKLASENRARPLLFAKMGAQFDLYLNALRLKISGAEPIAFLNPQSLSMSGAGHAHKGQRFVTHSTLPSHVSAIKTFIPSQKILFALAAAAIIAGLVFYPRNTAIAVICLLSFVYFIDTIFNFFLVGKSLNAPPDIKFTAGELASLSNTNLPVYTILCPLYKEAHVLPGFLQAINKLDWPKNMLDVQLLLEEDDLETITTAYHLDLPEYVRVVVVPDSLPKTKPKACNYGLNHAKGEYLVIYDAEDIPEPLQLKKAYLAFQRVSPNVMCLQAKLNYFNPHHNLLTRLFTAEYSLWFDVILPGLQSINTYIPLGGTSNHFRTHDLMKLHGWDPFNVTEDCDLGARLFKQGSTTAIIDSVTLEEANSNYKNWIRQRSRWIKGYMQTYLVHMRNPVKFFQDNGFHVVIFQLVVGGKIAFMLINPFLWLLTIGYFLGRETIGPVVETLYPAPVYYAAIFSLIFGNFSYIYYYMIGCAKRGHWSLIKYIYFVPLYWFMGSLAAAVALYQLIVKPHFWEKTHHGLHLNQLEASKSYAVIANTNSQGF